MTQLAHVHKHIIMGANSSRSDVDHALNELSEMGAPLKALTDWMCL